MRTRRMTAWITIVALLSMQVAVASYACPVASTAAESGMANCASMPDTDQPGLCQAHNNGQSQLNDHQSPMPPMAVFVAVASFLQPVFDTADASSAPRSDSYYLSRLAPDGSPPLFLSLQVLRI